MAMVTLSLDRQTFQSKVGVMKGLQEEVFLGTALPVFNTLLIKAAATAKEKATMEVLEVQT